MPNSIDVTLYLGTDDAWHLLGTDGGGLFDIVFYLVAGTVIMACAALAGVLTLGVLASQACDSSVIRDLARALKHEADAMDSGSGGYEEHYDG